MENFEENSPFKNLLISSHDPLRKVQNIRSICKECQKTSKYFCYRCLTLVELLKDENIPKVDLSCQVDM